MKQVKAWYILVKGTEACHKYSFKNIRNRKAIGPIDNEDLKEFKEDCTVAERVWDTRIHCAGAQIPGQNLFSVGRKAQGPIEAPVPNQSDAGTFILEQNDKNELQQIASSGCSQDL